MTQIRAFLAIEVPEELKLKIYKVIKEFKKIDANVKYVELENLHLTLKFFGQDLLNIHQMRKSTLDRLIIKI